MSATRANQFGGTDYTSGAIFEDLQNFITLTSPEQTPFLSMIGTNSASNPRHEWLIDTLTDPDLENYNAGYLEYDEGDNTDDTPTRLHNNTQVFAKTSAVEGSLQRSKTVAKKAFAYNVDKRKKEIRRDIEARALNYDIAGSDAAAGGAVATGETGNVRRMGGLAAYAGTFVPGAVGIQYLTYGGSATAISGEVAGEAYDAINATNATFGTRFINFAADPTDVGVDIDALNAGFRAVSEAGGMIDTLMVPTGLKTAVTKQLIDGNGGAAQRRADEMATKLNLGVDMVLTDFGQSVAIVHNYLMQSHATDASRVMYGFKNAAVKRSVLSPYQMHAANIGMYGKGALITCEETLEVSDPSSVVMWAGYDAS